jgi:hypothetical protein
MGALEKHGCEGSDEAAQSAAPSVAQSATGRPVETSSEGKAMHRELRATVPLANILGTTKQIVTSSQ